MRTVLWTFGWIGVAVWTLFLLGAFAFLGIFGETLRGASGYVPGFPVETFSGPWLVELVQSVGTIAIALVWALGTAMILAVPAIASLFLRRRDDRLPSPRSMRPPEYGRTQGGAIDRSSAASALADRLFRRR